jgi:hypothetical protein
MRKETRICVLCGSKVHKERHAFGGKFCSKKCELDSKAAEEKAALELEFVKKGVNALTFKEYASKLSRHFQTVVAIGDTHHPFSSQRVLRRIYGIIKVLQPRFVIQVGDLNDFFSQSKYPRTHRLMTPQEEVKRAKEAATDMWAKIHEACPSAIKIQIKGNHDERPYKRLLEKAPELEPFFQINDLFEFPHVHTVHDSKQEVVIDGICYQHGHKRHGEHMKHNLMNTVHGHTHRAGINYMKLRNELIWEFDVGVVADLESVPMGYGPQKWNNCTNGVGVIDELGPRFIDLGGEW